MIVRLRTRTDSPEQNEPELTLEQQWDQLRESASTPAERTEIDAIFGRHAA